MYLLFAVRVQKLLYYEIKKIKNNKNNMLERKGENESTLLHVR
jgi:hypothetical protein